MLSCLDDLTANHESHSSFRRSIRLQVLMALSTSFQKFGLSQEFTASIREDFEQLMRQMGQFQKSLNEAESIFELIRLQTIKPQHNAANTTRIYTHLHELHSHLFVHAPRHIETLLHCLTPLRQTLHLFINRCRRLSQNHRMLDYEHQELLLVSISFLCGLLDVAKGRASATDINNKIGDEPLHVPVHSTILDFLQRLTRDAIFRFLNYESQRVYLHHLVRLSSLVAPLNQFIQVIRM